MPRIKLINKRWIFVVLFIFLFIMVLGLNARISEYFRLSGQHDQMQVRIDQLKGTQVSLETQIAYAASDKAVEEWARTYERMGRPGDQIIIPIPEKDVTQEINYIAPLMPEEQENWQIWMRLFFDE